MDTLSQILQATRARSPLIADMRLGLDLSIGIPALGGIPFHYVADGRCRLVAGTEMIEVKAGDFVMLTRTPYYRLETGKGDNRLEVMDFAERDSFSVANLQDGMDHLLVRDIGEQPMQARLISAIVMPGNGPEAGPLTRDLPTMMVLPNAKSLLEPWLSAAIDFMSTDVTKPEPGISAIAERLIELIFISVLRHWLLDSRHEPGWTRGLTDPTISRVLNAIHAQPGRPWTLTDLAVIAGRSRSGLAEHFRNVMDETPFAYLTRWRMQLAAAAIVRDDCSISKIGASLGYQNMQPFIRAFRTAFGVTPAHYRRHRAAGSFSDQSGH